MGPCLSTAAPVHTFDAFDEPSEKWASEEAGEDYGEGSRKNSRKVFRFESLAKINTGAPPKHIHSQRAAQLQREPSFVQGGTDGWFLYLDDNRVPYFYNTTTGLSQWAVPPVLKSLKVFELAPGFVSVFRPVPEGCTPGTDFTTEVYSQNIQVTCPDEVEPGDELLLQFALYVPEDNLSSVPEEESEPVDPVKAWSALAKAAGENEAIITKTVSTAKEVLKEVSGGCYLDQYIFQLTWSYRLAQLELAVKEAYRLKADFRDSSSYDNCNGVPRYAKAGLIEWWQDLKAQRADLDAKLASTQHDRLFGDASLFRGQADTSNKALEASLLSDDAAVVLKGLLDRKKAVELELDNDIARVLAIVSIEGPPPPPTKEALDLVHEYLLDKFRDPTVDLVDMADELEEFVSNTLEPRHRFVVDVLTSMALLEFELDSLNKQIEEFTGPPKGPGSESQQDQQKQQQQQDAEDGQDRQSSSSSPKTDNAAVQALLASQHLAASALQDSLDAKKAAQKKALLDRIEQQRLKKVALLKREGLSDEEAQARANDEAHADAAAALEKLDREASDAMKEFHKKALEDLKRLGEEEEARLSDELAAQRDKKLKALRDRLEKRKEKKTVEIANSGNADDLDRLVDSACAEIDAEGEAEEAAIRSDFLDQSRLQRGGILNEIKSQHEVESQRLKDELLSQQEKTRRALQSRLNQKLHHRASLILKEEAGKGNALTPAESLALAQAACEKGGETKEETEALAKLDAQTSKAVADTRNEIVSSLKELHDREVSKLKDDLASQEESQRAALQAKLARKRKSKEAEIALVKNSDDKKEEMTRQLEEEEKRERASLESSLAQLKAQHAADAEELGSALLESHEKGAKSLQERLAKKKAAKDQAKAGGAKDGMRIEDLVAAVKAEQQAQLKRLKLLLEQEKRAVLIGGGVKIGGGSRRGSLPANAKSKLIMQVSVMGDSMLEGFKKRAVYLIKAVKALPASLEGFVSPKDAARVQSDEEAASASRAAFDSLVARSLRDMAGHVDVQSAEKASALAALREKGASRQKLAEAELKLDNDAHAALSLELLKALYSVAALQLPVPALLAPPQQADGAATGGAVKRVDSVILDEEEEEGPAAFGADILAWIEASQDQGGLCVDSLHTAFEHLDDAHRRQLTQAQALAAPQAQALALLSEDMRARVSKPLLAVLVNAFCKELGSTATTDAAIVSSFRASAAQGDFREAMNACAGEAQLVASSAAMYSAALEAWLLHPVLSPAEQAALELSPKGLAGHAPYGSSSSLSASASPSGGLEDVSMRTKAGLMQAEAKERAAELDRCLSTQVDKRKRDLQARLALQREQRERLAASGAATPPAAEEAAAVAAAELELQQLDKAQAEVSALLLQMPGKLEEINADGLMAAVDKKLKGGAAMRPEDLLDLQRQAEAATGQAQTQRLIQQQLESAEKLDIAMKVKKVKDQKSLQERLLKRKQQQQKQQQQQSQQ